MLIERVNKLRHLFHSKYDLTELLHFFIKRMNFTQSEFFNLEIKEREKLLELEKKVIEEEQKQNDST